MPLAGRRRTATPMLIIACTPKTQARPAPASRVKGSRSAIRRTSERTTISFDNLYSEMTQVSTNYQIGAVGLNRNNTNGNRTLTSLSYQTYPTTSAANNSYRNRRGIYATCTSQEANEFRDAIDCGQSLYGNTPVFTNQPHQKMFSADRILLQFFCFLMSQAKHSACPLGKAIHSSHGNLLFIKTPVLPQLLLTGVKSLSSGTEIPSTDISSTKIDSTSF